MISNHILLDWHKQAQFESSIKITFETIFNNRYTDCTKCHSNSSVCLVIAESATKRLEKDGSVYDSHKELRDCPISELV